MFDRVDATRLHSDTHTTILYPHSVHQIASVLMKGMNAAPSSLQARDASSIETISVRHRKIKTLLSNCRTRKIIKALFVSSLYACTFSSGLPTDIGKSITSIFTLVSRYANVTAGQSCVYELTGYTTADHDGQDSTNIIVRDNCRTAEFFCDSSTSLCVPVKEIGQQCQYNRDCRSVS